MRSLLFSLAFLFGLAALALLCPPAVVGLGLAGSWALLYATEVRGLRLGEVAAWVLIKIGGR